MKPRGQGSLYRRGRVWWLKFYDRDGRARRESSGSDRQTDAARLLRRRISEVAAGQRVLGSDVERTTFEDLSRLIEDDYRANGRKSLDAMRHNFRALARHFAGLRAHEIGYPELQAYVVERLEGGTARATVSRELGMLRRAFVLAERAERATLPRFPTIALSNARRGFFEREQWLAVRRHLPSWMQDVGDFAYLTGWRVMEILTLQWRQVDFTRGTVRLDPGSTKNGAGRVFPFAVMPALEGLLARRREETARLERERGAIVPWVFHRKGVRLFWETKPLKSFRRAWRQGCERSGYPGKLLHDFRRTAVRNLVRAGVAQKVAMEAVGMKTDAIFRRYEIVSEADLAEGLRRYADYIERAS